MIRVVSFDINNKALAEIAFHIRTEVFVIEQNVPAELEYDNYESIATHYLLYYNEIPIATARWRLTDTGIKLERFAVIAQYRNQAFGAAMLSKVLLDTIPLDKPIYLNSQINAIRFYEKHGFIKTGNPFFEAGIEHYKMYYSKK